MADSQDNKYAADLKRIYEDTDYFITEIVKQYGFYGKFIESLSENSPLLKISRKTIHKQIENQWVSTIENCLPALDTVMRNHSIGIEEREEVLPIELSRNINNRSIRHLAQHTDYISSYDGDTITPSKILNVFNEETVLTYENKFVNTLINRLYVFVDRRYSSLKESGTEEVSVDMNFTGKFMLGSTNGRISLSIETSNPTGTKEDSISERIEKIHEIMLRYRGSNFVKIMDGNFIRPPVMRTNAISKNKYLRQCLDLWDFIESYDKIGYALEISEKAEQPSEELIQNLYSMLSLQYMAFNFNIQQELRGSAEILDKIETKKPIKPKVVKKLEEIKAREYDVFDTEYRKVMNISLANSQRRLTTGEMKIRRIVDIALSTDKKISNIRKRALRKKNNTALKQ